MANRNLPYSNRKKYHFLISTSYMNVSQGWFLYAWSRMVPLGPPSEVIALSAVAIWRCFDLETHRNKNDLPEESDVPGPPLVKLPTQTVGHSFFFRGKSLNCCYRFKFPPRSVALTDEQTYVNEKTQVSYVSCFF